MFQYQQQYDQLPPAAALFHPPHLMPPAVFYQRHCRRTGKVKFFNVAKGYGFIIPNHLQYPQEQQHELTPCKKPSSSSSSSPINESKPNRVEEVFVHHTSILSLNKGYLATLNKGEEVEYELHDGPKGIYALHVTGLHGRYLDCNKYAIDYPANTANAIAATTTSSFPSTTTTTQQYESSEYHRHISELTNSFPAVAPPPPSHHNAVAAPASLPVGNSSTYPMPSLYHHHHHQHQHQQQHFVTYIIPHHHHYL